MSQLKDAVKKKALLDRLSRVEGQLRGVQLAAARKALDKSFFSMVGCMIEQGDQSVEHVTQMLVKFG